ncbi:cysteine-rich and transmembrane domain-containing protein 1-like [Hemicordylus capensis]|uniref:cysteine-rich and transmembrane domain-containing protein 1-like n=1 Tax=Hemicordylus capensis TaxID=884348 RepID=UPI0023027073|nr:cysteine-rich and transmembrane domain-containing protein 1-like [Hemicordylus capensis]
MMSYPTAPFPTQNPPPYSENLSEDEPNPSKKMLAEQPQPGPMGYGATPPMAPQYQQYGQPGAGYGHGPIITQPMQAVFITQPVNEPDYLGYSIFTMLCCCLPLGIAALVYSIQTREANLSGNIASAQRNSRMSRIFNHTALGLGIVILILYITLMVILTNVYRRP